MEHDMLWNAIGKLASILEITSINGSFSNKSSTPDTDALFDRICHIPKDAPLTFGNIQKTCETFFNNDAKWFHPDPEHNCIRITCDIQHSLIYQNANKCVLNPAAGDGRARLCFHTDHKWEYQYCSTMPELVILLCQHFVPRNESLISKIITHFQ